MTIIEAGESIRQLFRIKDAKAVPLNRQEKDLA